MSRFSDNWFVPIDSDPFTPEELLRQLDVDVHAPFDVRRAAVADWLSDHRPAPRLLECLVLDGLVDAQAPARRDPDAA